MAKDDEKPPSREVDCGVKHETILDAIRHARENIGARRPAPNLPELDATPYWGRKGIDNYNLVVGYAISEKIRWRLDWDEKKGIHVNEENYTRPYYQQKVVHRVITASNSEQMVRLQWMKWTSRYTTPMLGDPPFDKPRIRNKS